MILLDSDELGQTVLVQGIVDLVVDVENSQAVLVLSQAHEDIQACAASPRKALADLGRRTAPAAARMLSRIGRS